MESWEIGRCQSSPPCRASTACPPTGITGHKTDLESQKLGSCFGAARKHLYKFPSAIAFDKPGWCWAWSASPAENGLQHHVHSTICARPEGCLWTICCCLPPVWTRGHRQKGCSSQQPWWFNFYFAFHYTATTYWHAQNSRTKQCSSKTVREIPESQQEKSDYVLQIFMLKCDVGSLKRLSKQGRKRKQSVINGYLE